MSRYLTLLGVALCVSAWLGLHAVPVDVHLGRSLSAGEKAPPKRRTVVDVKQVNPVDLRQISPAEKRIQAALNQETETGFVDTPLKEGISFLAEMHHIEILVDNAALNEEGLDSQEVINLDVAGITLRSALRIILEPLQLTYIIENEVMKVTTDKAADKKLETHVYDVRKLAKADLGSDDLVEIDPED